MWESDSGDLSNPGWRSGGMWCKCANVVVAQRALASSNYMGRAVGPWLLLVGKLPMVPLSQGRSVEAAPQVGLGARHLVAVNARNRGHVL